MSPRQISTVLSVNPAQTFNCPPVFGKEASLQVQSSAGAFTSAPRSSAQPPPRACLEAQALLPFPHQRTSLCSILGDRGSFPTPILAGGRRGSLSSAGLPPWGDPSLDSTPPQARVWRALIVSSWCSVFPEAGGGWKKPWMEGCRMEERREEFLPQGALFLGSSLGFHLHPNHVCQLFNKGPCFSYEFSSVLLAATGGSWGSRAPEFGAWP